jgi:type VI secretion system protein ImpC
MADAKSTEQGKETETIEADEFASLLKQEFRPKSDRAREEVEQAVATLASQVVSDADLITEDAINTINAIIAEFDA